jgi:hypothetical protein
VSTDFAQKLAFGKSGETEIAQWLLSRGCNLLPVYEIAGNQHKGPAVYCSDGSTVIAPDLFAFKGGRAFWIEAKHKTAFTLHRQTGRFVTGIDMHHYEEYRRIDALSAWPVWLLFLHRGGIAKDSPQSPSGLYGRPLHQLEHMVNHTHKNHGRTGMIYWAEKSLIRLADYPLVTARKPPCPLKP